MKLDRNINPDGRGKYALINLRRNTVEWGTPMDEQFFVIKYKDRFAAPALRAYAKAVREFAENCGDPELHAKYTEYADEIDSEAVNAETHPSKKLPT